MRVLIVAGRYPSYDAPRRGAFVRDVVAATAEQGVDAKVVGFDRVPVRGDDPVRRAALAARARGCFDAVLRADALFHSPPARSAGVPVARVPLLHETGDDSPDRQVRAGVEALVPFTGGLFPRWRPDVIHAHGGLVEGAVAAAVGREHDIPVVVSIAAQDVDRAVGDLDGLAPYEALTDEGVHLVSQDPSAADKLALALGLSSERIGAVAARGSGAGSAADVAAGTVRLYEEVLAARRHDNEPASSEPASPALGEESGLTTFTEEDAYLPTLLVAGRRALALRIVAGLPKRLRRRLTLVVPAAHSGEQVDVDDLGVRIVAARQGRFRRGRQHPEQALRRAVLSAARGLPQHSGAVEAVALDAGAAVALAQLRSSGVRLAPGGARWLVDRWNARRAHSVAAGPTHEYQPQGYWSRLHARQELSAVGQAALPTDLNVLLYRALERNLRRFVRRHHLLDGVDASFDVGAGTGYWVNVWHDLGVPRVDGCDLVPDAVERLQETFGARGDRFVAADMGSPDVELPEGSYGLVSVLNVLLHITDEVAFGQALANVARLVRPGGHLLLVEPAVKNEGYEVGFDPRLHSRARRLDAYVAPLVAAGLEPVTVEGAVATANNPIEGRSDTEYRAFKRWWRWVSRTAKSRPERIPRVGRIMLALDRPALLVGAAPSSKFLLLRRPEHR